MHEGGDSTAGRATIKTIAVRAGVSKSLVSMVMNGSPHVSEARRARVLEAARELGYRPNRIARSLVEGRTNLIGVVVSNIAIPSWVEVVRGIEEVVTDRGLRTILADPQVVPWYGDKVVDMLLELHVDGLILVGTQAISDAARIATGIVPSVFVNIGHPKLPHVDTVMSDDAAGIALILDHLEGLGHRRITFLGGSGSLASMARRAAFEAEMARRSPEAGAQVALCDATEDAGHAAAMTLLGREDRPTAMLAADDLTAAGAMAAAMELGIGIPSELSLVGYDNLRLASLRCLALTTVDSSEKKIGVAAGRRIMERIERPQRGSRLDLIEPQLVLRHSTAPPGVATR